MGFPRRIQTSTTTIPLAKLRAHRISNERNNSPQSIRISFPVYFLRSILLTSPPSTGFASKIYTLQLECFDILSSDFPLHTGISFQMIVIFNLRRIQFRLETATPSVLFSVIFDIFFVSLVIQIRLAQIFVFFLLNKNSITSLECFCYYKAQ